MGGNYQSVRAAVRPGGWLLALVAAAMLLLFAVDYLAFALKVRSLQIAADDTAVHRAYRLREGLNGSGPARQVPGYQRRIQTLPSGMAFPSDIGAVEVAIRADWRSPIFGSRRTIEIRSIAAIIPDAGAGSRIARVR